MLRESLLSVEVEVDTSFSCAAAEGPAATASHARSNGVGIVSAIVGGRYYVVGLGFGRVWCYIILECYCGL